MELTSDQKVTLNIELSVNAAAKETVVYHKPLRHPVFLSAIDNINTGKYNDALLQLQQLIKSNSISPVTRAAALNKASLCLKNTGNYTGAVSMLSKIITNSSYPVNERGFALFQRATIQKTLLHNLQAAISDFNQYVIDFPNGIWVEEALYSTAELYYLINDFKNAAPEFQKYCDHYKDAGFQHEKALYTLGTIYSHHLSDFNRARSTFTRLLQEYPNSRYTEDVVFWNADCLLRQGHASRALMEFTNYIKRYPSGKWQLDAVNRLKKIETAEAH